MASEDPSSSVSQDFAAAAAFVRGTSSILSRASQDQSLALYALFKYSTVGACHVSEPSIFSGFVDKAKWKAWKQIEMSLSSKDESMKQYVQLVHDLSNGQWIPPSARLAVGLPPLPDHPSQNDFWNRVSTFAEKDDNFDSNNPMDVMIAIISAKDVTAFADMLPTVDINRKDEYGQCLLHFAADRGFQQGVNMLLSSGAAVNAQDENGNTPLHNAYVNDHMACVETLLQHGADASILNNDGDVAGPT